MPETTAPKRIAVHTLGCKLNYAETSTIAKQFSDRGFDVVPFGAETDVLLINTCSVTENAERECRQLIRRTLRKSPAAFVAVTGCYAQLRPEEIAAVEGVDLVLGGREKFNLFDHVASFTKRSAPAVFSTEYPESLEFHSAATSEKDSRTRAFLKVQDGCDYSCSYCTIPQARGMSRSGSIDSVVREARELSAEGFKEIVLSGVNVGDFGAASNESFLDLARALDEDSEVTARIRISSIEPNLLKDEIIELVAGSSKWCPHFHIPLQSGSPKILKSMQRRYNRDLYTSRIYAIKRLLPNACIGADVIVGFPGEHDSDFEETVRYLRDLPISYMHVFTYSERPGTKAAGMSESVPMHVRRERNQRLRKLADQKLEAFYDSQLSREAFAIFERGDGQSEHVMGYTENYVRVAMPRSASQCADVVRVRLASVSEGAVLAEPLEVLALSSRSELLPIL